MAETRSVRTSLLYRTNRGVELLAVLVSTGPVYCGRVDDNCFGGDGDTRARVSILKRQFDPTREYKSPHDKYSSTPLTVNANPDC